MRRISFVLAAVLAIPFAARAAAPGAPAGNATLVTFAADPLSDSRIRLEGAFAGRVAWRDDAPAFPGDAPGSLSARYRDDWPFARVGWPLAEPLDEETPFTAAAAFVIEPEGFWADPNGFFEISFGLYSSEATGAQRVWYGPDADTFELLEFDYFPNVSPLFGGPYLSPALFGAANEDDPAFPFAGAYANAAFYFGPPVELPQGEPLLALIEHRPGQDAAVVSVSRILEDGSLVPVSGAVAVLPLDALTLRRYAFDTLGLTFWSSGAEAPAIDVTVRYHLLAVRPGLVAPRSLGEVAGD
ncbi:MAG: hypothetical protein D6718_13825 [Acidobacteria bacterium]|nr:MAG: hypothetical protein D6718_13825 [Acidobacteriota bacterium]